LVGCQSGIDLGGEHVEFVEAIAQCLRVVRRAIEGDGLGVCDPRVHGSVEPLGRGREELLSARTEFADERIAQILTPVDERLCRPECSRGPLYDRRP
jgi:hypothetical protein